MIVKPSNAYIHVPEANRPVELVEFADVEGTLVKALAEYLEMFGFSDQFDNFGHVRVGSVHPFALLLFQDTMGSQFDLTVFPAITVADTSDGEDGIVLARDEVDYMLDAVDYAMIAGSVQNGLILSSDENMARVRAWVDANTAYARTQSYRATHNVDFNIWSDNKEITSRLYDIVKHFLVSQVRRLHRLGFDINGTISGRRSGDINVEFGKLLFGANVTVPVTVESSSMTVYGNQIDMIESIRVPQP